MTGRLTLADELLLLALDDRKGSVLPAAAGTLSGALAGAVLMELTIQGRLRTEPDGTVTAHGAPIGDPVHDEAAERIARSGRPHDANWWVRRIAGDMPNLDERLRSGLVEQGILGSEERKLLWVIPQRSFPLADDQAEAEIRDRVRRVVLDGESPDERTTALLGLVRAANLLDELFAPHERREARARIEELTAEQRMAAGAFGGGLQGALMGALLGATLGFALGSMLPDFGMDDASDTAAASESDAGGSDWDGGGDWD